eukprot:PLAT3557.1.p1 GENE.PLAT3557.1~~PLAT3557.1.p1  ORF type:complete len:488 (-),score=172.35 PLAT3557.1:24-1487(-)
MTAAGRKRDAPLSVLHLSGLTFFLVSGGAYGLEELLQAGGAAMSLTALALVPFLWAIPTALMTAELSSALPQMGGYVVWVRTALGDRAAFVNAWWNVVTNLLDASLYPVMFADYIGQMFGLSKFVSWLLGAGMLLVVAALNMLNVELVGRSAAVLTVAVLFPFVAVVIAGAPLITPASWLAGPRPLNMARFMAVLLWNNCGYDSAGTLAAEVSAPQRVYVRSLLIVVAACCATYALPLAVGVCVEPNVALWEDGFFVTLAERVGGQWLKLAMLLGGAVSSAGLLLTMLCTSCRALVCIARFGYAPAGLARLSAKHGSPLVAIAVTCAAVLALSLLDFGVLAEADMFLYCLTLLAELLSLVRLRTLKPDLPRPFTIPLSDAGVRLMAAMPAALCLLLMAVSTWVSWLAASAITVVALLVWQRLKGRLPARHSLLGKGTSDSSDGNSSSTATAATATAATISTASTSSGGDAAAADDVVLGFELTDMSA